MGKHYSHISPQARLEIHKLLLQGLSIREMAIRLGCHRSTLYRELERNSSQFGYRPDLASQQSANSDVFVIQESSVVVIKKLKPKKLL